MRGTWQTTGGSDGSFLRLAAFVAGAVVLASSGTAAALAGFLTSLVEVMGAIVVSLIALTALAAVLLYRRGWRPSLDPVVAYTPLPAPEPARALPAPQTVNINIYGTPTREQLAGVAALRESGYRADPVRPVPGVPGAEGPRPGLDGQGVQPVPPLWRRR